MALCQMFKLLLLIYDSSFVLYKCEIQYLKSKLFKVGFLTFSHTFEEAILTQDKLDVGRYLTEVFVK